MVIIDPVSMAASTRSAGSDLNASRFGARFAPVVVTRARSCACRGRRRPEACAVSGGRDSENEDDADRDCDVSWAGDYT